MFKNLVQFTVLTMVREIKHAFLQRSIVFIDSKTITTKTGIQRTY